MVVRKGVVECMAGAVHKQVRSCKWAGCYKAMGRARSD